MKTLQLRLRPVFLDFDQKKLKRVVLGILLLNFLLFAYSYYTLRDPFRLVQQYMPGVLGAPRFLYSIYGPFGEAMDRPMAVTVHGRRIYVADTGHSRVMVFDYNGEHLFSFGSRGSKPGELSFPYGLGVDSQGRILVADMYNGNISVFSPNGEFLHYFGSAPDLASPAGLVVSEGRVYVTDVARHKVIIFDEAGDKIFEFGGEGSAPGQFLSPNAIAVAGMFVAVSDTGNHRVQIFNKLGTLVREISVIEPGRSFVNPRGVGFSSRGELFTVNNLTHQVAMFNPTGELQFILGKQGHEPGEFFLPNGLFVDDQDRIYVTDTTNRKVNVFQ